MSVVDRAVAEERFRRIYAATSGTCMRTAVGPDTVVAFDFDEEQIHVIGRIRNRGKREEIPHATWFRNPDCCPDAGGVMRWR